MSVYNKHLLKNYLSNIQIHLLVADFIHCPDSWREINYTPDYNKMYFIVDGQGWLKIGDKEYYPKPGQLYLLPAGIEQSYSYINRNTFTKYWCHFTASVGDTNLFDMIKLPSVVDVEDRPLLERLFTELMTHYLSCDVTASLKMKSVLLEIIALYIDSTVVEDIRLASTSAVEKLGQIIQYIDLHLSENITVDDLANQIHFHPNYFIRLFHNQMGCTPIQYINKMRLEKAKNLLSTTNITITEIANLTGFNDVFYFSKAFKNATGLSPTEYKSTRGATLL